MLIILFILALIRTLHGVPLASPSNPPDSFTTLDIRDTQGHFGQRTVNDIIISCFATIFACTWSAVHPNIPAVTDSAWTRFKRRVTITICALVAPELVTLWAMRQRVAAQRIMDEYNKDVNGLRDSDRSKSSFFGTIRGWVHAVYVAICGVFQDSPLPPRLKEGKGPRWTLAHGFFLQMGGFMLCEYGQPTQILQTVDEMRENVDPPRISEEDIKDRSKGDTISKTFIILQTTWFIVQCIARWSQHLPVTELEVVTLGFAMLNGITYGLWWHKPQNVGRPVFLESKAPREGSNENLALTSTAIISASEAESESNLLLPHTNAGKESFLRRKLREEMKNHACSPKLLWRLPYRMLQAPVRLLGKMIGTPDTETEMRVGIFYAGYTINDGVETVYAISAIGTLFGAVHLIPSWFLHFSSRQEMWLWRVSAIIITVEPIMMSAFWFDDHGYETLGNIFGFFMAIGALLYPIARIILLTLSLTALRSLPPPALQTIEWTTFIPHL